MSSGRSAPIGIRSCSRIHLRSLTIGVLDPTRSRCSQATSSPTTPAPASCTRRRRHGADDYELFVKNGLVDRMTHNVLEDSSFAPHVPFFAGLQVFDSKGKEGKANKAVIDKLIEAERPARPRPPDPQLPALLALQGPGHLPQHPAVVRRHRPPARRPPRRVRPDHPPARADLDRPPGQLVPADRAQPALLDDRGPPRLGAVAPARLGRAADLLRQAPPRRHRRDPARPGGQRPHQGGLRARGRRRLVRGRRQGALPRPTTTRTTTGRRSPTSSTSGSTPARTHAFALRDRPDGIWPASVYLEGTDQHRGWFHSSMLQACGTRGRAPYDAVLTHGFTLDENGMKMSKSLGNTTAPEDVIRQYGADILRLWVAQSDYTVDLRIGPEILKGTADSYRRLRNTLRFLLGALDGFDRGRAGRAGRDARARPLGAAPAGRARRGGAEGLRRLRLPARVPERCSSSPPSTSRPSTSTSARTRSTATPAPARAAAPPAPCSTRSSTASSPGSRRCCPSPWRRSG